MKRETEARDTAAAAPAGAGLREIRRAMAEGSTPPVARLVGFSLTKIGRGRATIELDAGPRHANPMGTLHGGIMCDIADAAMGMAYASLLEAHESFTTIELKVNFLRPFWSGHLLAEGKVIRKGRSIGLVECRVSDDDRRLVAYSTSTCMTLPGTETEGITRRRARGGTAGRPKQAGASRVSARRR